MTTRVAMWSGPRNISTAMMRAWENRPDAVVVDEPFYAHYLARLDGPRGDHPAATTCSRRSPPTRALWSRVCWRRCPTGSPSSTSST